MSEHLKGIATAVLIAVLGVAGLAGLSVYYFPSQSGSGGLLLSTTNVSYSSAPPGIADFVQAHLDNIQARNVTAVANDYRENSTLTLKGVAGGIAGTYKNAANVTIFYMGFLRWFADLGITNGINSVAAVNNMVGNGESTTATFSFYMHGHVLPAYSNCGKVSDFNGTVRAEVSLIRQGDGSSWLISAETWDFVYPFNSGICAKG